MMRILTWNIQHGGGKRVPRVIEAIASHKPDVIVLTEFKSNAKGESVRRGLSERGFDHQSVAHADAPGNSVLIAAREPFEETTFEALGDYVHRCVMARTQSVNIVGLYFPNKAKKKPVFEFLVRLHERFLREPTVLIGDFNTGKPYVDQPAATILCAEYLDQLEQLGWIDAWRHDRPHEREYTWYSSVGNGFRLDHAFVSPPLSARVHRAFYSHTEREIGISDHSILIVDLNEAGT